jgi:hypothetical protein
MPTTNHREKTMSIKIVLSDRAPVTIVAEDWPVIAEVIRWSGEHRFQSFDEHWIKVREHKDGRRIVYGYSGDGQGGGRPGRRVLQAGFLIEGGEQFRDVGNGPLGKTPDDEATIRAIRRVVGIVAIGDSRIADEVIAELPAEELA